MVFFPSKYIQCSHRSAGMGNKRLAEDLKGLLAIVVDLHSKRTSGKLSVILIVFFIPCHSTSDLAEVDDLCLLEATFNILEKVKNCK